MSEEKRKMSVNATFLLSVNAKSLLVVNSGNHGHPEHLHELVQHQDYIRMAEKLLK